MSDFFTPIQVLSRQKENFEVYEVQKYNDDPFQMTFCCIQSLGDNKKKIIQWLKQMPLSQRIQQLSYTNKQFASLFMSMMQRKQEQQYLPIEFSIKQIPFKGYMIQDNKKVHLSQSTIIQAEDELLRSLLIMNKFSMFDTLTVNVQLSQNINRLFQLFQIIQNGICHELCQEGIKQYENEGSSLMFYNPYQHNYSFKSIGLWVVQVLKKTISFKYFKNKEENINKQLYDVKQKNKKVLKFWKKLQVQNRQSLINKVFSQDVRNLLNNYRQIIHVVDESFPNIKYSTLQKITQLKQILIKDNGNHIFRLLTYTLLPDTIYSLAIFKYQILNQIQQAIHREQIKQEITIMKKKKTYINNYKAKDKKKQLSDPLEAVKILEQKKQIIVNQPNQVNQVQYNEQGNNEIKKNQQMIQKQKKKKKKKNKKKYIRCDNSNHQSQTTNQPQDLQQQQSQNIIENQNILFSQKKNKQLQKIYKKLSQKTAIYDKYRRIAVNRIAYILQKLNLSYQLFGSFACDLTIPNSDIDICIDPTIVNFFYTSFCSYRQKILMSLQFLQNAFEKCSWTKNFNFISTASVPVLIFQVNLNKPFDMMSKDKNYNIPRLHRKQNQVNIKVDLTIQPYANLVQQMKPHLGQHSTQIIRQWTNSQPYMKQIIKIFKYVIQKQNLNKSFMGGLSSFVLSVIVASFFIKEKDKQKQNFYQRILGFFKYVFQFRQQQQIIDIRSRQKIIQNKFGNKLIVINPINGKNLSQNCHRFKQIKQLAYQLFNIFKNQQPLQNNQFLTF